ncbi:MAG: hypothetical protein ACXAEU_25100 [Candidatus Hodarchaeales archaeon]|jgi:uncharacterized Zn finger protein (UPF0148 family)
MQKIFGAACAVIGATFCPTFALTYIGTKAVVTAAKAVEQNQEEILLEVVSDLQKKISQQDAEIKEKNVLLREQEGIIQLATKMMANR